MKWGMGNGELGIQNVLGKLTRLHPHSEFSVLHSPFCVISEAATSPLTTSPALPIFRKGSTD